MEMISMTHELTKLQNEINEKARQYDIRRIEIPEYISDNLKYHILHRKSCLKRMARSAARRKKGQCIGG